MKIHVAEVKRHIGNEAAHEFSQAIDPIEFYGETISFEPAQVKVRLINSGESITAFFDVNTKAKQHCSLCLEQFDEAVSLQFEVVYQEGTGVAEGPEDAVFYQDDLIDVSEDVRQQVILALPMKPVCTPDCRGLCPKCGQNLNAGMCNCPEDSSDSKWTVLKDLLKED